MRLFQIDQRVEYPLSAFKAGPFTIRSIYARSRETRQEKDTGQDYITYKITEDGILFCVCDGVSQSFFGNLAAKYFGDSMLQFMSDSDCFNSMDQEYIAYRLRSRLRQMTVQATNMINRYEIPPHINGILREVLDEKRMKGSETTFVCGKIMYSAGKKRGQITAAWLGDTYLRMFGRGREIPGLINGEFSQWNRWSTCQGVMGQAPSILAVDFEKGAGGPDCVQIVTDGLLECRKLQHSPDDAELRRMIEASDHHAASDDISFLEISWGV